MSRWPKRPDGTTIPPTYKARVNEDPELFALRVYAEMMPLMSEAGLRANLGWIDHKTADVLDKRRKKP
jgi:hypothetical protein